MTKETAISAVPQRSVVVHGFTNALLDPAAPMLGIIAAFLNAHKKK